MPTIQFSRATAFGLVAIFSASLVAPVAVSAETEFGGDAPVIAAILTAPEEYPAQVSSDVRWAPESVPVFVSPDVRWAPEPVIAPAASVAERRAAAAEQALRSPDLGSMQEEALTIVVESSAAAVEAAPVDQTATLDRGTRSESAVLWTILETSDMAANSDDRIANALFGTGAEGYS